MITELKNLENLLISDSKTKYFVNILALTKYKFDKTAQSFVACADSRTRTIVFGPEFFKRTEKEKLNVFFEEILHIFLLHSHRIMNAKESMQNFDINTFKLACEIERQQIQSQLQFIDLSDPVEQQINGIRQKLLESYDLNKLSAEQIYLILQNNPELKNNSTSENKNSTSKNSETAPGFGNENENENNSVSENNSETEFSETKQTKFVFGTDIEDKELSDSDSQILSEINKEILESAVKEIIKKLSENRGFGSAYQQYLLKLKKQKSIKNILSQIILKQRNKVIDFRKINKKSDEILLYGYSKEKKDKILIIFDVSGSMHQYLDDAYSYVNQIAKYFKNTNSKNVRTIIADTDVIGEIDPFQTQQKILGLGGTQMDIAYKNSVKDENIVIFVTDCDTDFPTKNELKGKSVYCISVTKKKAPKHIKTFNV